jgi:4-hydroxy-tetrahydrodipicolinate reductase
MKIALIGYGNMGKEIKRLIENNQNYQLVSISYEDRNTALDIQGISQADVAIDFSSAEVVVDTVSKISHLGVPLVIGTTGWYDKLVPVKDIVEKNNMGLVYGQNFSIGANIFFKILEFGSQLASTFDLYDVYGLEVHHSQKKDSPSGTARKISSIILENFPAKQVPQYEKIDRKIKKNEFHLASIRAGRNPGFHEVVFDSAADSLTLSHQAHNRSGFAQGALLAAKFILGKKGIYTFDDVFQRQVNKNE